MSLNPVVQLDAKSALRSQRSRRLPGQIMGHQGGYLLRWQAMVIATVNPHRHHLFPGQYSIVYVCALKIYAIGVLC